MNLNQSRVGLLATPTTPLWSGTVISYTVGALAITLIVATETGSLTAIQPDMAVWGGGDLARVQSVNAGANTITLGENPVSANAGGGFVAGAAVAVYNIYQILPKYERNETNYVVTLSDPNNELSAWHLSGAAGQTLYFEIDTALSRVLLFTDSGHDPDSKVARGAIVGTRVNFEQKNSSGITGYCTIIASPVNENGSIRIEALHRFQDYNQDWASLGADDEAREKAAQKPIAITDKSALILGVGESETVSGAGSFATYNGYAGGTRAPATIASYAWTAPACLIIVGSSTSPSVTVQYSSDGFGYLDLVVTDSNGSTNVRHIPVWANIAPYALSGEIVLSQSLGVAPNIQPGGVEMQFTSYVTVSLYRFSLICLYDRDTQEPIFLGWLWEYRQNFDPGQNLIEISGTARDALATLKNTYSYSFHLTGKKDFALDWVDFNMLSIPRAIYFWENWHTTLYGVANLVWDTSPEQRLQYMVDFAPGNCYEAVQLMARCAFYDVYSDGLSNIRALVSLCYAATITGAGYDAITRGILASEGYSVIAKQFSTPTVSEVNTIAAYHTSLTAGLNFFEITVRAPNHPALMGNPADLEGLISNPLDISDPGYNEILQFVGRHMANANTSNRVTFKTTAEFSLLTYRLADIPDEERLVLRELRETFHPDGNYWEREITGQTFGRTVNAVIVPPITITDPTIPEPIPPDPIPASRITLVMNNGQLGISLNAYEAEPTIWTNLVTGSLAGANVDDFYSLVLSATGEAWLLTGVHVTTHPNDNGLWYCADVFSDSPVFSLVVSQTAAIALDGAILASLGCGDDGTVYCTVNAYYPAGHYLYGKTSLSLVTGLPIPQGIGQYAICSGASVRLAMGSGGVPAWGIRALTGATSANVLYVAGDQPDPQKVAVGFCKHGTDLFSYVDGGGAVTLVYAGTSNESPIMTDGVTTLTVRASDGVLMNGATQLYTPLQIFLVSGRSIGWYCFGAGTTGALLAIASTAGLAANFISLLPAGASAWVDKSGDWISKMGANWQGWDGAGFGFPVIVTLESTE